ncbi:MAG: hypothetical protein H0M93_01885 [Methanophagales archaeon]|nr:hypothetical protein [Methanophagales archaeon]
MNGTGDVGGEGDEEKDAMDYYETGKELFFRWKHDHSTEHVREIETKLRKAIELNHKLWAPHYYLGEVFYLGGRYSEAKAEFEEVL